MIDNRLAWRVEQACFNAWPALNQMLLGDWCARFGAGLSRRNNSANPLSPRAEPPDRGLGEVEALYRRWSLTPRFRVPSLLGPEIPRRLQALGYQAEGETLTLFAPIDEVRRAPDARLEVLDTPSADWLAAKAHLSVFTPHDARTCTEVVGLIALPAGFALLREDGEPAAAAYGVIHDRLLCVEAVVTDAQRRGRGLGRRLLSGLFDWAGPRGAEAVCLQVQADNAPAVALYRGLGLTTELYRYHYRRAP